MSRGVKWEIHCVFLRFAGFKDPTHLQYNTIKHCKVEISVPIRQLLCTPFIFYTVCSAWRWPTLRSQHVALKKYVCACCVDCHCIISNWNTYTVAHLVEALLFKPNYTGSFPDGVIRVFLWRSFAGHTMALVSTQSVTEMSARNFLLGGKGGRCLGLTTLSPSMYRFSWNRRTSTTWNPQGLHRNCFTFLSCREEKHAVSVIKNQILYREIIALCSEINMKRK